MTQNELKVAGRIGAELGAAKAKVERLAYMLRYVKAKFGSAMADSDIEAIDAAITQHAEPADAFTATDMATAAAQDDQYPPCDYCGVIPDHHPWHGSGMFNGEDSPHIHACNDCRHLLPTRPAQTEQQPSAAQQILDLIMEECRYWHGRDEARRGNFANLYAAAKELADNTAPIAQTAPQGKFRMGDLVKKSTGSEWEGRVVGWYSTEQTKEGYAVESSAHRNSVQIYPAKALEAVE